MAPRRDDQQPLGNWRPSTWGQAVVPLVLLAAVILALALVINAVSG